MVSSLLCPNLLESGVYSLQATAFVHLKKWFLLSSSGNQNQMEEEAKNSHILTSLSKIPASDSMTLERQWETGWSGVI